MSPVSRGRRPKPTGKRKPKKSASAVVPAAPQRSVLDVLDRRFGPPGRPSWFDDATAHVLDGADVLTSARHPRELDDRTAELVGAELHRLLQGGNTLRFEWWFTELVDAAADRLAREADGGAWQAPHRLLYGLSAQSTVPTSILNRAKKLVRHHPADERPGWVNDLPRVAATGEVHRLVDAYGLRYGVIAEHAYPRTGDRVWFLLDIEASGDIELVDADTFDDLEQAAAAWRERVGTAATAAACPGPEPVRAPADLQCLSQLRHGEGQGLRGNETRRMMNNWLRVTHRMDTLAAALRRRGTPLSPSVSLYRKIDVTVMTDEFTDWYAARHDGKPDPDAVEALAAEWMAGALPETVFLVSPRRITVQRELIGDWAPDRPVTMATKQLMPEWVRWLLEGGDLTKELQDATLDALHTDLR